MSHRLLAGSVALMLLASACASADRSLTSAPTRTRTASVAQTCAEPTCISDFAYVRAGPTGLAVHYVDDEGNDVAITPGFPALWQLNWSADGSTLTFVAGSGIPSMHVYAVHPDGTGFHEVTSGTYGEREPRLSPDASRISYLAMDSVGFPRDLRTVGTDGSGDVLLVAGGEGAVQRGNWTPDGRSLVVSHNLVTSYGLYLVDAATGAEVPIPAGDQGNNPVLSPNGQTVAFDRPIDGRGMVVTATLDSPGYTPFLTDYAWESAAGWSYNGKQLLFLAGVPNDLNNIEIVIANADGTGIQTIGASPGFDSYPSFSPNGHYVLFTTQRTGGSEVWVMGADGSATRSVTPGAYAYEGIFRP